MDAAVATVGLPEETDWPNGQPTFPPHQAHEEGAVAPGARLPDEPAKAWFSFRLFRDQGPLRTMDEVGRQLAAARGRPALTGRKVRATGRLRTWARRWRWRERAEQWDQHRDVLFRTSLEKEIREMSERHAHIAVAFQTRVAERLAAMSQDDLAKLTPTDLIQWFSIAVKLERLARGLPGHTLAMRTTQEGGGSAEGDDAPTLVVVRDPFCDQQESPDPAAADVERYTGAPAGCLRAGRDTVETVNIEGP
jgi:hypothetical protein